MYCMYAILNFNWTPSQFSNMTRKEKAFVIACIDEKVQSEKNEIAKMKR